MKPKPPIVAAILVAGTLIAALVPPAPAQDPQRNDRAPIEEKGPMS